MHGKWLIDSLTSKISFKNFSNLILEVHFHLLLSYVPAVFAIVSNGYRLLTADTKFVLIVIRVILNQKFRMDQSVFLPIALTQNATWLFLMRSFKNYWAQNHLRSINTFPAKILLTCTRIASFVLPPIVTNYVIMFRRNKFMMLRAPVNKAFVFNVKNKLTCLSTASFCSNGPIEWTVKMTPHFFGLSLTPSLVLNAKRQSKKTMDVCIWHAAHVVMNSVGYA